MTKDNDNTGAPFGSPGLHRSSVRNGGVPFGPRSASLPAARPSHVNAGMTSFANSSAERRVSANVMSPNANSSEK